MAKAAEHYYNAPSFSGTAFGTIAKGEKLCLHGVVEGSDGKKWYAVLKGVSYAFVPERYLELSAQGNINNKATETVAERISGLSSYVFKFMGDPAKNKKLTQTLDLQGKKGDVYMVNAWGLGTPLPETDNDKAKRLQLRLCL